MQKRVLLALCLLVASASARQAAPSQPTAQMVKRTIRLEPRLVFGSGSDSSNSGSSGSATSGTDSGTGSGSSSETGGSRSDTTSASSSSQSSSSSATSSATSSTQSTSATRPTSTSHQSTTTATIPTQVASTTDSAGSVIVVTSTLEQQPTSTSDTSAAAASASESAAAEDSGSSHTGLIIGVSVVGGVAIIGALIFLYMKFGGKRFSEYEDHDADIKWPELKSDGDTAAMQPLPARRTGGAGFDMGNEFDDGREDDGVSMAEYGHKGADSMTASTTALNAGTGAGANYYGGGTEGNYQDDMNNGSNGHYSQQPAEAGYYEGYSGYPSGHSQSFYPDQGHDAGAASLQQFDGYQDYHPQGDPYGAGRGQAQSATPPMQPYRVGGQRF